MSPRTPSAGQEHPSRPWRNWADNQSAFPSRTLAPDGLDQIIDAVTTAVRSGLTVKVAGSGHSFSDIARPEGVLLTLQRQAAPLAADPDTGLVTVQAGITLRTLNRFLWTHGLALPNLGDIDAQTVAGAVCTASHGTGVHHHGLASQLRSFDLVLADGSVQRCSASIGPELFDLGRVSLGALGVLTTVSLQCEPAFWLHAVQATMPLDELTARVDELIDGNEHFEFFWFPDTEIAVTKQNNRADHPQQTRSRIAEWVSDELLANAGFELLCRLGRSAPRLVPSLNRLSSHSMSADYTAPAPAVFTSPRRVRFLEMEYAVPRAATREALTGIRQAATRYARDVTFPVEVRFAAADDIPLSMAYGRDTTYFAVHVYRGQPHQQYFQEVEATLTDLAGRPHWGKLHTKTARHLRAVYPRYDEFRALRDRLDPARVFRNSYLDRVLDPDPVPSMTQTSWTAGEYSPRGGPKRHRQDGSA